VHREKGAEIRVYSGSSAGLQSGTRNHVPVTMVEINFEPRASAELDIAASYNGLAFVIDGLVRIGDTELNAGQVGWLDRSTDVGTSVLRVVAANPERGWCYMRDNLKETQSCPMAHL
jgi:quercetin 2,3-dioxygenase